MLIARRFRATATVTQAAEVAIRLEIHAQAGRQLYVVSPRQAETVRRELGDALTTLRTNADHARMASDAGRDAIAPGHVYGTQVEHEPAGLKGLSCIRFEFDGADGSTPIVRMTIGRAEELRMSLTSLLARVAP